MDYKIQSVTVLGSSILTNLTIRNGTNNNGNYNLILEHEKQVWGPQAKRVGIDESYFGFGKDAVVVFDFTNPTLGGEKAHNQIAFAKELGSYSTLAKVTVYRNIEQFHAGLADYSVTPKNGINPNGGGGGNLSSSEQGTGDLYLAFQTNIFTLVERQNGYMGPLATFGNEMMIMPSVDLYQTLVVDKTDVRVDRISDLVVDGEVVSKGNGFFSAGPLDEHVKELILPPVCFVKGSKILTERGLVAVEELKLGDLVQTFDHGMQKLLWIGKRSLKAGDLARRPKARPICVKAHALGPDMPNEDLALSPQHRVLLRSKVAERIFGTREVLAPVRQLVNGETIAIMADCEGVDYFHLLFERHEVVFANGAAVESLYTGKEALKSLSKSARRDLFELFPKLRDPTYPSEPARDFVQGKKLQQMLKRHENNEKQLYEQ